MARKEILDRIEKYIDPYRVTNGKGFRLKHFDPGDTCGLSLDKGEAADVHKISNMRYDLTILAYEMNGAPLSVLHGAPLRLRCENELGFKMVKWIATI